MLRMLFLFKLVRLLLVISLRFKRWKTWLLGFSFLFDSGYCFRTDSMLEGLLVVVWILVMVVELDAGSRLDRLWFVSFECRFLQVF